MEGGRGPHLSEDTFRRVEKDDESWQGESNTSLRASKLGSHKLFFHSAEQLKIECQYCHVSFSVSNLTTHEVFVYMSVLMCFI